jgi:putative PIN family toxin of toxin-antitoxin system
MKKIVIDTSVIISALIGEQGPSRRLLRKCLEQQLKPMMSNTLFTEYEDVCFRENIQLRCPLTESETRRFLNAFYSASQWVSIHYIWRPNLKDEGDNFLVELAVAGNAKYIVTNNVKDFSQAQLRFDSFSVITPEQATKEGIWER